MASRPTLESKQKTSPRTTLQHVHSIPSLENAETISPEITLQQIESVIIKDSRAVTVTQVETELLAVLQLSLQASIQAVILFGVAQDLDVRALQKLSASIGNIQKQKVVIEGSENVIINQLDIEIATVVQAAIQLMSQILEKVEL